MAHRCFAFNTCAGPSSGQVPDQLSPKQLACRQSVGLVSPDFTVGFPRARCDVAEISPLVAKKVPRKSIPFNGGIRGRAAALSRHPAGWQRSQVAVNHDHYESRMRRRDCACPRRRENRSSLPGSRFIILIPLFNDWDTFAKLAAQLDEVLAAGNREADILIVDDASVIDADPRTTFSQYRALRRVEVLRLRRNLGHQRAIAVGLTYIQARMTTPYEAVVVMDGDGEDAPEDVPRLLDRLEAEGGRSIVFAERTRRSESLTFRFFYFLYRHLHFLLTSVRVRVGNFSAIPRRRLESLVAVSELWNHYAAAAFHSRQPYCTVPTERARRLGGRSSMNFVSLVTHGLSAISVYREVIGVRLLVLTLSLALLALVRLRGHRNLPPAGDFPGHPRLGHVRHRLAADRPPPGDDAVVRLLLRDPGRPQQHHVPAAARLPLLHRRHAYALRAARCAGSTKPGRSPLTNLRSRPPSHRGDEKVPLLPGFRDGSSGAICCAKVWSAGPEGARQESPGQRPGYG